MLFDSHSHLHSPAYDTDREEVLARMRALDVQTVTIGTNQETSKQAIDLAESSDRIFASVAYHPEHLTSTYEDETEGGYQPFEQDEIKRLAGSSKKVVAIGETGLDYFRMDEGIDIEKGKDRQREVFEWHLDLAAKLHLAVVVHVRDAFNDLIEILARRRSNGYSQNIVIHCFTGNWNDAQKLLDLGCYLSFTGIITFKPRKSDNPEDHMHRVIERMPIERLMIETDAPWLSPEPHRGDRNEPGHVQFVAKKVAELRGSVIEEVQKATFENAIRFFDIRH